MKRTPLLTGEIKWSTLMQMTDASLVNKREVEYRFSNGREFRETREGGTLYDPCSYNPPLEGYDCPGGE
jgi:hypothetical protein